MVTGENIVRSGQLLASRRMAEQMKKMVRSLNARLQPIFRLVAALVPNPMPPEVIAEGEGRGTGFQGRGHERG
jgi:hypothetical protein